MTQLQAIKLAMDENEKYSKNNGLRVVVPKGQRTLTNHRTLIEINPIKTVTGTNNWEVEYTLMKSEWELKNIGLISVYPDDLSIKLSFTDFYNDYESFQ